MEAIHFFVDPYYVLSTTILNDKDKIQLLFLEK